MVISLRLLLPCLLLLGLPAWSEDSIPEYLDEEDPQAIDVEGSLDYAYSEPNRLSYSGDLRGGFFDTQVDLRDGGSASSDEFALRFRYGANFGISEFSRLKGRLAVTCSDSECDPNLDLLPATTARIANTEHGDIVLDELYLDFFQRGRFDVALGRMQTRSATRGGVFISSLSRMTSPNVSVNWTDGLAMRYLAENNWNSQFIAQYNDEDGSSTLARQPLDFSDDDSRVSVFYSLENLDPWGVITQRAFDITYLPSALLKNGTLEDYWTLVGRFAARWPVQSAGPSLIVSGEIGYAPETPTSKTVLTGDTGDSDGLAWHLEASWMDVLPGHSFGINYARSDPGWLLSPVYRPNEETLVLRYHWRPMPRLQVELQGRWREDLEQLLNTQRKREVFDWRLRLTWRLPVHKSRRI